MHYKPLWLAAGVLSAASLLAQSLPPTSPAATDPKAESTVVLSPFEVTTNSDVGYLAQNTLAGSRMNTGLKDLSAAISPLTEEFLKDIAATNVTEAIEYGVNTRIETDDGRLAGPVGDGFQNVRDIRIRGLPGGSRTVNYFRTLDEVDTYKAGGMEVARGPNSILYGFGSPAGVVNSSTKEASLIKPTTSLSVRADTWGGYRTVLDANTPLIKNTLGLRTAILKSQEASWRRAGHDNQQRLYLAGTWNIDRKTKLKAQFERGSEDKMVPRPWFGVDLMSVWESVGRPTFTDFTPGAAAGSAGAPGRPLALAATAPGLKVINASDNIVFNHDLGYAENYKNFAVSRGEPTVSADFGRGRLNPEAVIEANWVSGQYISRNYSATLQRQLPFGFNAEMAFSQQFRDSRTKNIASWELYGISADPNTAYPSGGAKPADRVYYYDARQNRNDNDQSLRIVRALLSYEHDFRDWAKLRVATMFEQNETENRARAMDRQMFNGPDVTSGGAIGGLVTSGGVTGIDPTTINNRIYERFYLNNLNDALNPNFRLPGPQEFANGIPYRDPTTGVMRTVYPNWISLSNQTSFWDENLQTRMVVSQLYLLKNRFVLTGGYRLDRLRHYSNPPLRDPAATARGNLGGYFGQLPNKHLEYAKEGNTLTRGGVVHLTSWLSGFYNASTAVNVPGSVTIFGADPATIAGTTSPAPLRDGITQDYGFKLDVSRGETRLFATATRFDTQAHNDTYFSGFGNTRNGAVQPWRALRGTGGLIGGLSASEAAFATAAADAVTVPSGFLQDTQSKGYEFELVGGRGGWNVSINYSRTEARRQNQAVEVRAYMDHWKKYWLEHGDFAVDQTNPVNGQVRVLPSNDFRTPEEIRATGDFTLNTDTIREAIVDAENSFFNDYKVLEGLRSIGDNKHNFNFRTRYAFRDGPIRGVTIGGGMRYRMGRVAGAVTDWDFKPGSSYTDAYNGRIVKSVRLVEAADQALFDLQISYRRAILKRRVTWELQLNVNNLTGEDDLITNSTQVATGAPRTYRYQDPRLFILTNTFSF